jgi:hypothetical protein
MKTVKRTGASVKRFAYWPSRKLIAASAREMSQRMATEYIKAEENAIAGQDDRSDADAEFFAAPYGVCEPKSTKSALCVKGDKDHGKKDEVPVNVLHDKRK